MEKPKILYVEDHLESALLVRTLLKNKCEVFITETYEETMDFLKDNSVDLILLDINLPGKKDGVDLVKDLKQDEKFKKVPIIALTAYALAGDRERLLEAGCDEYIAKPMTKKELFDKLKKFIQLPEDVAK
ncbi:MAG: response regulator [Ignavibacterium sp.]|jgi:CheY-like chemotaxis protein|nr:response regulator [Ignavibacteria bacterium]MDH7527186.1 response regulator [Ignavibacteria bacterium]GIV45613.1 MAG: response regulator [Ignavibacterium sp.]